MFNLIKRLENVIHIATFSSCREHITPSLERLHWLPVPITQRAIYKILLLTYKALNGMAPKYISALVQLYAPARALSSKSNIRLPIFLKLHQ